jgi:hypothetical protein
MRLGSQPIVMECTPTVDADARQVKRHLPIIGSVPPNGFAKRQHERVPREAAHGRAVRLPELRMPNVDT